MSSSTRRTVYVLSRLGAASIVYNNNYSSSTFHIQRQNNNNNDNNNNDTLFWSNTILTTTTATTTTTTTACEPNSFPDFSRYGKDALIRKYLTLHLFQQLREQSTASGVTLEDLMRAAVSLPYGARPPRGVAGIYAGDAESYRVFAPLLDPIIEAHHHPRQQRRKLALQRHRTNLNPRQLIGQKLDPDGQYILNTRIRLARSIQGFRFAPCISRAERRQVEQLVKECLQDWEGAYKSTMHMTNEQHDDLIQRHVLFRDPDEFALAAGTHRDWPDARGVYLDSWEEAPSIMIWCNNEDHVWIISNDNGGDVQKVFSKLSKVVGAFEVAIKERGYAFVEDGRLGFLTTCPTNIGTALRASVYVKLPRLGQHPGFYDLLRRLELEAVTDYSNKEKRYTGIFDIANLQSLGKSEVELINVMIDGVARLIGLEKRLEKGENVDLNNIYEH